MDLIIKYLTNDRIIDLNLDICTNIYRIKMSISQIRFTEHKQQIIIDPYHEVTTNIKIIEELLKLDAH